jgi:hypothetical protein
MSDMVFLWRMKGLQNILLIIALFFVALPCTHADEHFHAFSVLDGPTELSEVHSCECHSGESNTVCTEPFEVEQNLSIFPAVFPVSAFMIQLFVLNQSRPTDWPVSPHVPKLYIGLATTQLLI